MTIINQNSSITHDGNGLTTLWPYDFIIPDDDAARVGLFDIATNNLVTLDPTDYEITGVGSDDGGEVKYPLIGAPISAAKRLVIWRALEYVQETELTNQTPYYPKVLEGQLDLIVMQVQQLAEQMGRSIKVTLGSNLTPDEFVEDLQEGAAEAQASANAAAESANAAAASANDAANVVSEAEDLVNDTMDIVQEVALSTVNVGHIKMMFETLDPGYIQFGVGGTFDPVVYPELAEWMSLNFPSLAEGELPDWTDRVPRTADGLLGPTVGGTQEDALQDHAHVESIVWAGIYGTETGQPSENVIVPGSGSNGTTRDKTSLASLIAANRTASETRVKSFGVRWQIKAYGSFVNQGTVDLVVIEQALNNKAEKPHLVPEKVSLVDDDELTGADSENGFAQKRWKWSNLTNILTGLFFELHETSPSTGWMRFFGVYLQWGYATVASGTNISMPRAFPNGALFGMTSSMRAGHGDCSACLGVSTTTITLQNIRAVNDTYESAGVRWIAVGY